MSAKPITHMTMRAMSPDPEAERARRTDAVNPLPVRSARRGRRRTPRVQPGGHSFGQGLTRGWRHQVRPAPAGDVAGLLPGGKGQPAIHRTGVGMNPSGPSRLRSRRPAVRTTGGPCPGRRRSRTAPVTPVPMTTMEPVRLLLAAMQDACADEGEVREPMAQWPAPRSRGWPEQSASAHEQQATEGSARDGDIDDL